MRTKIVGKFYLTIKLMLSALVVFALISCSHSRIRYRNYNNFLDSSPGIKQRPYVTDRRTHDLEKALDIAGVNVLTVGQDYRVIIPVEKLFYHSSPRIQWRSYGMLNMVVDYIKQFRKVSIRVSAYSKDKDRKRAGGLSYARAREVSDYLWSQLVDARIIYTQSHSMEPNEICCGKVEAKDDVHAHIEIAFRNTII